MHCSDDAIRQLLGSKPMPQPAAVGVWVQSAVCLPLVSSPDTHITCIRKASRNEYHWRGHIALPGGRIEPEDASGRAAALRELHEELGVPPEAVTVLGSLGHHQTITSNHNIEVVVASLPPDIDLRPDPREIDAVFAIDLEELLELHRARRYSAHTIAELGEELTYDVAGQRIWGVTARILHTFLGLIAETR